MRLQTELNNRPVSGRTKLGSISIHFQGATTAVRERVRVGEKRVGVSMRWWEKCGESQARYDSGKTIKKIRRDGEDGCDAFMCVCIWELFWILGVTF